MIPDISYARMWGDEAPPDLENRIEELKKRTANLPAEARDHPRQYLAISGGGANGAFGAGLLAGWTESGKRPQFDIVTGVSTGALIAPLAFLGPKYDPQLKEIYTSYNTEDIATKRRLLKALTGDAMYSTEPLKKLIDKYLDENMMREIAAEFGKGRLLMIGTTNLDSGRPVLWNIGRIAESGHPKALELTRTILLASAAIPAAFPPVFLEVEANGKRYQELHVDGGATTQVFLYPVGLDWKKVSETAGFGRQSIYVILNSRLRLDFEPVEAKLGPVAVRSIDMLIKAQCIGDIYRIFLGARRDGLDYNLAYIPDTFKEKPIELFDPPYMQKLFDLGFQQAKAGYAWEKTPPGMTPP